MRAAPSRLAVCCAGGGGCEGSLTSFLGLLDLVVPFAAVGVDHATAATSKATVQGHGHRERVEPVEKANTNKLAELHFDSPESAGHRHNAPLTQITQVQYWSRGGAGVR